MAQEIQLPCAIRSLAKIFVRKIQECIRIGSVWMTLCKFIGSKDWNCRSVPSRCLCLYPYSAFGNVSLHVNEKTRNLCCGFFRSIFLNPFDFIVKGFLIFRHKTNIKVQ